MERFVIVRGPPGVYAGYLESEDVGGVGNVVLRDAFCLWRYCGAANLSQVAQEGVNKPADCKFSNDVPVMRLKQIFQIIPVTEAARKNLQAVKRWKV